MEKYSDFIRDIKAAYKCLSLVLTNKQSEQDTINAFKKVVQICIPYSSSLITNGDWKKVWKKYNERSRDIVQNSENTNNSYYFIDYALLFNNDTASENDRKTACKLFCAFENVVKALDEKIKSNKLLKQQLKNKVAIVIKDGPPKADDSNNSAFKNFINEIVFFYEMVIHETIELVGIEVSLSNGNTADFQLCCDGSTYFVDVITIHNTINTEDINRFVEGKVNDKFSVKAKTLTDESILNQFRVLPLIECNDDRLLDYIPKLPDSKCLPPMMPLLNETDDGYFITLEQFPLDEEIKKQLKQSK